MNNSLILIDGSNYLHRAFHATPSFNNAAGFPTGAIFGLTNMLKSLLQEYQPEYAVVVFDAKGKTFRNDLYPEYKANRPPMDEDLAVQIPFVLEIVAALGFPVLQVKGVEADDVIGTLAKQAEADGKSSLIFTGDKDFAQLVNDSITIVDTMKNVKLDAQGVENKFGIPPSLILDYLALIGDTVDNIPGVNKVGPKTAIKWLTTYGSLLEIIKNACEIKGKVGENLRATIPDLPLTQQLLTIKTDVVLTEVNLKLNSPNINKLYELYSKFGFKKWLAELPQIEKSTEIPVKKYETILSQQQLELWLQSLNAAEFFAFDTETTSLNYLQARIVGISFAVQAGEAAYIPLTHDYLGVAQQLDLDAVLQAFQPLLENPHKLKVGQNIKYDAHVLANHGINLQGIASDTMLESYVLDSTSQHNMDALAQKYLNLTTIKFEEVAGKGKKQLIFNQVSIEQAAPYAAEDADITLQLHQELYPRLEAVPKLNYILHNIELPLISVLIGIERNGVLVDANLLHNHSKELADKLQQLEQQVYTIAGEKFNLNSPKQLQVILFEKLQLPILKRTPKKDPSTAVDVLEELAIDYPLPKLILEYRSLSKLKSTYTDSLVKQINPQTGRVHTSYQQAVTSTGRLSSTNPNLQNIPVRNAEGRRIRQAFVAPKGNKLLAADYSQIELRIMAHLSQDESLLKAFSSNEDIHRATASQVFDTPINEVTTEQRRYAKAVNFGLIYGMQAFGLAKQLGIKKSEAQTYINAYFARYSGVEIYMNETKELAKQQGYVETIFGRRLYIPNIKSSSHPRRQAAERTAINAPMQGTAADLIKLAMIAADKRIRASSLDVKMLMQVHDELVFEIAEADIEAAQQFIIEAMTQVAELRVPLLVDVGIGDNWEQAH
ncbi:DNA polymerase I [Candidatus Halobeggiatoa sp. HSG11]|nr:DNA polymerase I [Candidatus Halobeggiatoa sp. HSG11]